MKHWYDGTIQLYVPRVVMPQVNEEDYPALIHFASTLGVEHDHLMFNCSELSVHQQVDWDKVRAMKADDLIMKKPCLVSGDRFVLDGNHRFWGHQQINTPVPAIQFKLPFAAAIKFLFKFPRTYSFSDGKHGAIQN